MPEWREFHLRAMLRRLDAAGVEFVVVGGIAAIAHGSPQITQDLDIVFATNEPNLRPARRRRCRTSARRCAA